MKPNPIWFIKQVQSIHHSIDLFNFQVHSNFGRRTSRGKQTYIHSQNRNDKLEAQDQRKYLHFLFN